MRRATPLTVVVDGRVLAVDTATFSNSDPGGFQAAQIQAAGADLARVGADVRVFVGADTAWHGLVHEPGAATRDTRSDDQAGAVGYGVRLRDNPFSQVYIDRDLNHWRPPATQRRLNLIGANFGQRDHGVGTDATTGLPALHTAVVGDWANLAISEAWYDAGPGNLISQVRYAWTRSSNINAADTNWAWYVVLTPGDTEPSQQPTANLRATGPGTGTLTGTAPTRFAEVKMFYGAAALAPGNPQNAEYLVAWTTLAVIGDHGLTVQGATSDPGLSVPDVWAHALKRSGARILPGRVDTETGYLIRHLEYRDAPEGGAERVMQDAANVLGWHTGTWEPVSPFDSVPRAWFTRPPEEATCVVYRTECDPFDAPRVRRDRLYNRAEVRHRDSAGTTGVQIVDLPNPALDGETRVLQLDLGVAGAAEARAYGTFALRLAALGARGGGSCTVGDTVRLPGGGRVPAMLLRAGRDRIQIPDLPSDESVFRGAPRGDTFLIRRVETTLAQGRARTRIEFDGGADLLEVLQARTQMALQAANLT